MDLLQERNGDPCRHLLAGSDQAGAAQCGHSLSSWSGVSEGWRSEERADLNRRSAEAGPAISGCGTSQAGAKDDQGLSEDHERSGEAFNANSMRCPSLTQRET